MKKKCFLAAIFSMAIFSTGVLNANPRTDDSDNERIVKPIGEKLRKVNKLTNLTSLEKDTWFYTENKGLEGLYEATIEKDESVGKYAKLTVTSTYKEEKQKRTDWNRVVLGYYHKDDIDKGVYKVTMKIKSNKKDNKGNEGKGNITFVVRNGKNTASYAIANPNQKLPGEYRGTRINKNPKNADAWETYTFFIDFGKILEGKPVTKLADGQEFAEVKDDEIDDFSILIFGYNIAGPKTAKEGITEVTSSACVANLKITPYNK